MTRNVWRGLGRELERPGEGEGDFVILDVASCGVASLNHDDGSSRIRNLELLLGLDCHSGTWFRVLERLHMATDYFLFITVFN